MDFGLGAFLEKFEEHFGSRWTRGLLIIVAAAVVATAGAAVWKLVVEPVYAILTNSDGGLRIVSIGWTALQVLACFGFASVILDAYRQRLERERLEEYIGRAESMANEYRREIGSMRADMARLEAAMDEAADMTAAGKLLLETYVDRGLKAGIIDQETADLFLSLPDAGGNPPH